MAQQPDPVTRTVPSHVKQDEDKVEEESGWGEKMYVRGNFIRKFIIKFIIYYLKKEPMDGLPEKVARWRMKRTRRTRAIKEQQQ